MGAGQKLSEEISSVKIKWIHIKAHHHKMPRLVIQKRPYELPEREKKEFTGQRSKIRKALDLSRVSLEVRRQ